jgi:hypothetical protein
MILLFKCVTMVHSDVPRLHEWFQGYGVFVRRGCEFEERELVSVYYGRLKTKGSDTDEYTFDAADILTCRLEDIAEEEDVVRPPKKRRVAIQEVPETENGTEDVKEELAKRGLPDSLYIDAANLANSRIARNINCAAEHDHANVSAELSSVGSRRVIGIFTTKKIKAGREILIEYGSGFGLPNKV